MAPRLLLPPLLLLCSAMAIIVVAAPGTEVSHRSETNGTVAKAPALAVAGPHRSSTSRGLLARHEAQAIDRVLRYTPFVAGGTQRRRMIALTFDDGPGPYTESILHILLRSHTPATFFIVGQELADFSSQLRDEVKHGFVVGDHTQNHAWLPPLGEGGQYEQIRQAADGLRHHGAPFPRLFRPPYGVYNAQTISLLRGLKMLMVMWSVDPGDWRRPGAGAIVHNVLAGARPGAIVIMHDGGGDRSQTVAALPAIIRALHRRHFQLVSVPQLLIGDPPPRHQRLPLLTGA